MDNRKLILFDWGNVLMDADLGGYNIRDANIDIADEAELTEQAMYSIVKNDAFWTLSGKNLDNFLSSFMPPGCIIRFREAWRRHMEKIPWYPGMTGLLSSIAASKPPDVDVGILSVCSEMDRALIKDRVGRYVKYYFLSCSMGMVKPDRRIFPLIETVLDIPAGNILYFDDLYSSVKAAGECGWNAVCVTGDNSVFIEKRCSAFIGQELLPDTLFQISSWMQEVHHSSYGHKRPAAIP